MSKPLKEDYIIRIKSRIEQRLDEPAAEEEKEEFVELMTRGSFVLKGGSYYVTYRETETTGYEGCTTTLKIAADGSRVAMLRFGKGRRGRHPAADRKRPPQPVPLRDRLRLHDLGRDCGRDRLSADRKGRHRPVCLPAGCRQRRAGEPQPSGSYRDPCELMKFPETVKGIRPMTDFEKTYQNYNPGRLRWTRHALC